jgi:glycosyltransferase involved in cell wall biosynthesis
MKVLYDISAIGRGYYYTRSRAGIFRVCSELASELARVPDCDLVFVAPESYSVAIGCLPLLRELGLRSVPFSHPRTAPPSRALYSVVRQLTILVTYLEEQGYAPAVHLPPRAARKGLRILARALSGFPTDDIDPALLAQCEIYHSPFTPVPSALAGYPAQRFITIHDVIPALFPQFCHPLAQDFLDQTLDSVGEKGWVFAVSNSTRDDLCNYRPSIDPDRVIVTPLAASDRFAPVMDTDRLAEVRARYGIPADRAYFLTLNTLEPRKNLDQVLRCFARLVTEQRIDDLVLVLAGSKGWQYEGLFDTLRTLPRDRVILTGHVADGDLAPLYAGALAFLYPSFYEGFGLPPLEAMQCGAPVIASNTASLPEVVGDAGILISPDDADALCSAMLGVYQDTDLRRRLQDQSLERADRFSWKACARATFDGYQKALGAR